MNEQAKNMIAVLKNWHCPDNLKEEYGIDKMIQGVYNEAMKDAYNFIDVMIDKNPKYRLTLQALKHEMFPGMVIGNDTK